VSNNRDVSVDGTPVSKAVPHTLSSSGPQPYRLIRPQAAARHRLVAGTLLNASAVTVCGIGPAVREPRSEPDPRSPRWAGFTFLIGAIANLAGLRAASAETSD
jgi:hypothetical protein